MDSRVALLTPTIEAMPKTEEGQHGEKENTKRQTRQEHGARPV
jgi:hypothetical protein